MQRIKVNEKSFEGQTIYVGIDYHKLNWMVTIMSDFGEHKTMSYSPCPVKLTGYLQKNFPGGTYKAVYEAGFSGFATCRKFLELGVECIVIHAADVPTNQKERLQKTDKADSRKLARCLRSGELSGVHLPDSVLEVRRALVRQRHRIVKDIGRYKNRVKSLLFQIGIRIPERFTPNQSRHWSRPFIEWLKSIPDHPEGIREVIGNFVRIGEKLRGELLLVTRQVRQLSSSDSYREDFGLVTSSPGIGLVGGMTLLTELDDIKRFGHCDHLCGFVGLVPSMHVSGERMATGKMSRRGRKQLKNVLVEAAWASIRKDPAMMAKYRELTKRMNGNKAIIRIARKLLNRVRYILIHRQEYEMGVMA
jgi:transposase